VDVGGGWKGQADFSTTTAAGEDEDEPAGWDDTMHVDFFTAMTSEDWVRGINRRLWWAEMLLHATDGSEATLLTGRAPVAGTADPGKTWLLTIREPLVLCHMYLMHSTIEGEWRRLMGKRVQLHLSMSVTEAEADSWAQERRAGDGTRICEHGAFHLQWNGTLSDPSEGERCRDALGEDRAVGHDVRGVGYGQVQEHGGDDCWYAC
jgi:hypothetical protein